MAIFVSLTAALGSKNIYILSPSTVHGRQTILELGRQRQAISRAKTTSTSKPFTDISKVFADEDAFTCVILSHLAAHAQVVTCARDVTAYRTTR